MQIIGKTTIATTISEVWDFVSDPKAIAECMQGLSDIDIKDKKHFKAVLDLGLSFLSGKLHVTCEFLDIKKPKAITAIVDASGIGASAHATAKLKLKQLKTSTTELSWTVDMVRSGLLKPVPEGLIRAISDRIQKDVLECLKEKLRNFKF